MVVIARKESFMRPLYFGNKQIESYVFYDKDGIIAEYNRSCPVYKAESISNSGKKYFKEQDVKELHLSQVRNARKEDLSKKDNFILKDRLYLFCEPKGEIRLDKVFYAQEQLGHTIVKKEFKTFDINGGKMTVENIIERKRTDTGNNIDKVIAKVRKAGITENMATDYAITEMFLKGLIKL